MSIKQSATSSLQVRVNTKRKERVKAMFAKQGIPLSVAIEMFFAKAEEVRGIPFAVQELAEIPNAYFKEQLAASEDDEKNGRIFSFTTAQEAVKHLRKELL